VGSAIFLEYDGDEDCTVALTGETGTIKVSVDTGGYYDVLSYGEGPSDPISGLMPGAVPQTNWSTILGTRVP